MKHMEELTEDERAWLVFLCQRRVKSPQKCRSKFPRFHGSGDQPVLVICISVFGVGRPPAPLWRRWWGDWGVGADVLGDEVSMAA